MGIGYTYLLAHVLPDTYTNTAIQPILWKRIPLLFKLPNCLILSTVSEWYLFYYTHIQCSSGNLNNK